MEFITQMETGDAEDSHGAFGKFLKTIYEFPNTDARRKQFGKADVYDRTKLNLENAARALPGSRGKGNDRESPNLTGRSRFAQQERGGKGKETQEMRIGQIGEIRIGKLIIAKDKKGMMSIRGLGRFSPGCCLCRK